MAARKSSCMRITPQISYLKGLNGLGLPPEELDRHIAVDIGVVDGSPVRCNGDLGRL